MASGSIFVSSGRPILNRLVVEEVFKIMNFSEDCAISSIPDPDRSLTSRGRYVHEPWLPCSNHTSVFQFDLDSFTLLAIRFAGFNYLLEVADLQAASIPRSSNTQVLH
jgi:hypothetical protein